MNDTSPSDIEFCNVVKRYGEVQAVNGLDLQALVQGLLALR